MLESVKIGFLVDSLLSRYQVRLLNGALRAAHRRGAHVIGFQGSFLRESEGAAFDGSFLYKLAGPQAVDGLIVASNTIASMVGTDFLSAFCAKSGLPVVSIGDLPGYPQVTIDSRAALRAAIVHLVNVHGRRRLAFIRGNHGNPDSAYREQIFRATLAELHVEVDERLVLPGTFLEGSGAQAIRVLFDDRGLGPGELQGVVSANDQMAVGAVRELRARQLRVPEDVAVIGFDDDDHARSNSPPLTTIAQPIEALAEHAVELLIDCLRGLAIPERVELLAKPVYRRSCGCLRAAGVDHLGATAHEPLAEALAACRPVCIKRLEKLLGAGADTSSVDILMRALLAGGEELVSAAFDEFERALLDACEVGLEPLTWHDVLVPLFEVVSRRLELDPGAAAETEQRLGRARQIVSEVAARTHSLARLREIQLANGLRIFGSALAAARSLPGVARALEAGLPGLGIGYFCVCLFVEGSDRSLAWQLVRHEACAARNEVLQDTVDLWRSLPGSLPPGEPREPLTSMVFPAHDLLRSGSEPKAENFHLLTYPLVFAERALGYVVFDAPNHVARPWLLENVAGHLSGAVYALAGADQLRDARLIAERANAAKSEFVAMMSHEVRTPLTAIAGHIELCLRTALSPEQKSHLKRARASSRALLRIVNDILDFSKLEAQRMELEVVPFDLDELLDQVLGNYALEASRRDLELVLDVLPGTPSSFRGDPLRLSQVLANLLSNAVKFTAAGHVLVRVNATELTAGHCLLELTVHDTGIGMSDEELARIFKPFTQADSSTTRRYGGTGLGLSISKQLCDIMGGEIEATSRPPNGSEFRVRVPLGVVERRESTAPALTGLRALVVESCEPQALSLARILESQACEVSIVHSGALALAELNGAVDASRPFDLVFVAHELADISGLVVIERLAAVVAAKPTIVVTGPGHAAFRSGGAFRTTGASAAITKPFQAQAVLRAIARARSTHNDTAPPSSGHARVERKLHGVRVLLAQDDPVGLEFGQQLLEHWGAEVELAANGAEAVERAASAGFDLILLDLNMPRLDGCEAARTIRAGARHTTTPILALTASTRTEDRARAKAAGMDGYLQTPVEVETLLEKLLELGCLGAGQAPQSARDWPSVSAPRAAAIEPRLPLDIGPALARLNGDRGAFRRLIQRFVTSHCNDPQEVRAALAADDVKRAVLLVHTLASAAANIGAGELQRAAQALESMFGQVAPVADWLTDLDRAHAAALDGAAAILNANTPASPKRERREPSLLLSRVSRLLEDHDTSAIDSIQALRLSLQDLPRARDTLARLETSIESYDFADARRDLAALAKILDSTELDASADQGNP